MANTYTQIHIQVVFAVKGREYLLRGPARQELYRYLSTIVQNYGHKLLAIDGMADHVHLLIGLRPTQAISDLVREMKASSAQWLNSRQFMPGRFEWQDGYGAFSYSKDAVPNVIDYIRNQKEHHGMRTFAEEYRAMLEEFKIEYDDRYIFT
ncbi:MAG: IS200/IS605 family transposase [Chlorobiaceae bacterium]|nr:IS200/IS605 family transposase [Chlorobiaceae bacterium]